MYFSPLYVKSLQKSEKFITPWIKPSYNPGSRGTIMARLSPKCVSTDTFILCKEEISYNDTIDPKTFDDYSAVLESLEFCLEYLSPSNEWLRFSQNFELLSVVNSA